MNLHLKKPTDIIIRALHVVNQNILVALDFIGN